MLRLSVALQKMPEIPLCQPALRRAYMEPGTRGGKVKMSRAIAVGSATVERTAGDRYEWRDGAYAKKRRVVFDDGG